jgi:hypothetical protein
MSESKYIESQYIEASQINGLSTGVSGRIGVSGWTGPPPNRNNENNGLGILIGYTILIGSLITIKRFFGQ